MELKDYFEAVSGRGVLATADSDGRVDAAIYAKPHFPDQETIVFLMADRLTHRNLQDNPMAVYLFMESGNGYRGKRLYLTKIRETQDPGLVESFRRTEAPRPEEEKFVVYFKIDKVLPLIGPGAD